MPLEVGLFIIPNHPPNTKVYDANKFDLETLILADQLGFSEAWIGEHFTAPWELLPRLNDLNPET